MSAPHATTLSVTVRPRVDGRGFYANVRSPQGARRQLSWPSETDGQRWVAILHRDGWDAAMADYARLKSVRTEDRPTITADRTQGRTVTTAALEYIAALDSESSRRSYRGRLTVIARYPDVAGARVDRLTQGDLELFAKWLSVQSDAPSVRFNAWAFLSQVLNREVRRGHVLTNPCPLVDGRPKAPTTAQAREAATLVDDAEVDAILELVADPAARLLYRLLYASAARLSEGLALSPRHVKVQGDTARLTIERTWAHDELGGGWHLGPTKGKNTRAVYVSRELGEALLSLGVNDHGCLAFGGHSALEMKWNYVRNRAARLGVAPAGVRLHDLRHSRITNLLEAGANPVAVSRMAGHASVQFTLDRYGHVRDDAAMALAAL